MNSSKLEPISLFPRYGQFFVEKYTFFTLTICLNIKVFSLHHIPKILYADSLDKKVIIRAKKF